MKGRGAKLGGGQVELFFKIQNKEKKGRGGGGGKGKNSSDWNLKRPTPPGEKRRSKEPRGGKWRYI